MATSFDHARDRYVVELDDDGGANGKEKLMLKPVNLIKIGGEKREEQIKKPNLPL